MIESDFELCSKFLLTEILKLDEVTEYRYTLQLNEARSVSFAANFLV